MGKAASGLTGCRLVGRDGNNERKVRKVKIKLDKMDKTFKSILWSDSS